MGKDFCVQEWNSLSKVGVTSLNLGRQIHNSLVNTYTYTYSSNEYCTSVHSRNGWCNY